MKSAVITGNRVTLTRPSHCTYRGCMKPLPMSRQPHKSNEKFYCDADCASRDERFQHLQKCQVVAGRVN